MLGHFSLIEIVIFRQVAPIKNFMSFSSEILNNS